MKVYKTVFTNKWEIWELDTEHLKRIGTSGESVTDWSESAGHYGNIYNNKFYKTREAAAAYINKEPVNDAEIVRI